MAAGIKMRVRLQSGVAEVRVLISHPMETGRREDESGKMVPAHFIQLLTATLNQVPVLEAQWGTGVARDPYLIFFVAGARLGDSIAIEWHDNKGESGRQSIQVA
ncbi:thiosulfate oxidation carrier complex protein SoxZ [Methylobacillus gramineus]|uniref:thiosulfate oxidation carrier complex protein SoxZ n=1 Tax=Methylobacillus gramineus TaxID=755169 RepID=UPI001CFF6937|nr:thiosulfate oxidation carrier complex protein SoxZ [Methylobacillus gramineus]MCB5185582.1 thiosulfate oxidation carrier complex protein SoxZ [Methylobacillus gramineus]